ncbi:hypothetical protein P280DRAFT_360775, partial [Massarina eburnea CBS 473.64]
RRARTYAPVGRLKKASEDYPVGCSAFLSSLHDARYYQGILSNTQNFSSETSCDILHVQNGKADWKNNANEDEMTRYLEVTATRQDLSIIMAKLQAKDSDPDKTSVYRVIFCTIENANNTSFGCQLSLSSTVALALLHKFQISPQYLSLLLGEPDYWAPGDFASFNAQGSLYRAEFFCQQPRWNIHKRDTPWCVYMTHIVPTETTTYVVVCSRMQARNEVVRERLTDMFRPRKGVSQLSNLLLPDPFMLHLVITHEALLDAKSVITEMRYTLYDALDNVDAYSKQPATHRAKDDLERLTLQLHVVSQDIDSMAAGADMAGMILRRIADAHQRYATSVQKDEKKDALTKTIDAINYLSTSMESQMRWLNSYKSRRDIAMNLVFNLVTQQDAATSTTIAREAKADGTSMKIIAALTMVFLPGTYLSSVFGMASLENAHWWLYVALMLPLTLFVLIIWYI